MEYDQLVQKVLELESKIASLNAAPEVEPQYARTLGEIISSTSSLDIADETQGVNEAGSATYDVPKIGAGFIKIGDRDVMYW